MRCVKRWALTGKTNGQQYTVVDSQIDTNRIVKVQFVAQNNEMMPWEFAPNTSQIEVHPGESNQVTYYAKNTQDKFMVSQAIPSIVPSRAAEYFHKTECFCFNQQPLAAGKTQIWHYNLLSIAIYPKIST